MTDEAPKRLMTLEEAKRIVPSVDDSQSLSDRIHAAGGLTGSSKTPGAPWSTHGMRYASTQTKRGRPSNASKAARQHQRETFKLLAAKSQEPAQPADDIAPGDIPLVDAVDRSIWTPIRRKRRTRGLP